MNTPDFSFYPDKLHTERTSLGIFLRDRASEDLPDDRYLFREKGETIYKPVQEIALSCGVVMNVFNQNTGSLDPAIEAMGTLFGSVGLSSSYPDGTSEWMKRIEFQVRFFKGRDYVGLAYFSEMSRIPGRPSHPHFFLIQEDLADQHCASNARAIVDAGAYDPNFKGRMMIIDSFDFIESVSNTEASKILAEFIAARSLHTTVPVTDVIVMANPPMVACCGNQPTANWTRATGIWADFLRSEIIAPDINARVVVVPAGVAVLMADLSIPATRGAVVHSMMEQFAESTPHENSIIPPDTVPIQPFAVTRALHILAGYRRLADGETVDWSAFNAFGTEFSHSDFSED